MIPQARIHNAPASRTIARMFAEGEWVKFGNVRYKV